MGDTGNDLTRQSAADNGDDTLRMRVYPLRYVCNFVAEKSNQLAVESSHTAMGIAAFQAELKEAIKLTGELRRCAGEENSAELQKKLELLEKKQNDVAKSISRLELELSQNGLIFEDMTNMLEQTEPLIVKLIFKDGLTNAYNRYFFASNIESMYSKKIDNNGLCMAFLDIDDFKEFNSAYGHDFGDVVLRRVSAFFERAIIGHSNTYFIRMGGDEFIVLSLDFDYRDFVDLLDDIREGIGAMKLKRSRGGEIAIHVSIGTASVSEDDANDYSQLYQLADKRLFMAKSQGKDNIVWCG